MKKPVLRAAGYAAVALAVLTACSNPTDGAEKKQADSANIIESVEKDDDIAAKLPDDIASRGSITVALNTDLEPVKFIDSDGDITGINPELIRAAAKVLGIEATFRQATFESLVPGLEAQRFDVIGGIGDFVERQKRIDFVDFLKAGTGILASTDLGEDVASPKDLCGLRVGYVRGSVTQGFVESAAKACAKAGEPPLQGSGYGTGGPAILAVKSGEDDAFWGDLPQVAYNAEKSPDQFTLGYQEFSSVYGLGINKKQPELRDALRAALIKLEADGVYDHLLEQWGLQDYGMSKFPVNADISVED